MTTGATRPIAVLLALLVAGVAARADEATGKANPANPLVGSWKLLAAKYGGKEVKRPEGFTQIKHVTPTQFMWAWYGADGKVASALGGNYTRNGDEYAEIPEYGVGSVLELLKGKPQVFKWKLEGNKWYHTGKLSSGLTIEEVWERDERKERITQNGAAARSRP